jgi:hypothetical protein
MQSEERLMAVRPTNTLGVCGGVMVVELGVDIRDGKLSWVVPR